jgi:tetratricopeptide (TPR) repeat protein
MSKLFIFVAIISLVICATAQDLQKAIDLDEKGLALFAKGDYEAAIRTFDRSIEYSSRLDAGRGSLRNGFTGETAEEALMRQQIVVIDPRTAGTLVNRGNAYFAKGDLVRAVDDYERAIRISPSLATAFT